MKTYTVQTLHSAVSFGMLATAIHCAKLKAQESRRMYPAIIWDADRNVVIAVVTDDANGVTVHKLDTYPKASA